jgi:tetratricopeptide (TPR) repeat protein
MVSTIALAERAATSSDGMKAGAVGITPIENVHLFEDHDRAYDIWKAAGARDRVLVHFDGHLDFDWVPEHSARELLAARSADELDSLLATVAAWHFDTRPFRQRISIANFLYPAITEGIIRRFIWVMPDPFWATERSRCAIRRGLRHRIRRRARDAAPLRVLHDGAHFSLLGCPVTVCTLSHLPAMDEPVLLDIDIDYLLTSEPTGPPPYFKTDPIEPWLWPSTFFERLRCTHLTTDLVTVACSVNDGYTPLQYKYFGELLSMALRQPSTPPCDAVPIGSAAEAFEHVADGLARGDDASVRKWWEEMCRRDPSYRTAYAFAGWREERARRWHPALAEYDRMTRIDAGWHVPHAGRGRVLWQLRRYGAAQAAFRAALALTDGPTSARYWLGRCRYRRGDSADAVRIWTDAIRVDSTDAASLSALAHLGAEPQTASKPARNPGLEWSEVGTDVVILDRSVGQLVRFNGMAGYIWKHLDGTQTREDVVAHICRAFDIDAASARCDVDAFLSELASLGFLNGDACTPTVANSADTAASGQRSRNSYRGIAERGSNGG